MQYPVGVVRPCISVRLIVQQVGMAQPDAAGLAALMEEHAEQASASAGATQAR